MLRIQVSRFSLLKVTDDNIWGGEAGSYRMRKIPGWRNVNYVFAEQSDSCGQLLNVSSWLASLLMFSWEVKLLPFRYQETSSFHILWGTIKSSVIVLCADYVTEWNDKYEPVSMVRMQGRRTSVFLEQPWMYAKSSSVWNAQGRCQGWGCCPACTVGFQAATLT